MIELRTFGPLTLLDAEGREVRGLLAQPRRMALLVYLAVATPRGLHPRDRLLAMFWPELDQARARAALRQALHVLRSAIGSQALIAHGDEQVGVDVEVVRCDAVSFEDDVAAGRLREALERYRGRLADSFFISGAPDFEQWLEAERGRLQQIASRAALRVIGDMTAAGNDEGAALWAARMSALLPLDEALVRHLIAARDRLGDRAGAAQAYDEFARRLFRDLEIEPSAETRALIDAVKTRRAPVARGASAAPDPAGPRPAPGIGATAPTAPARLAPWLTRSLVAGTLAALLLGAILLRGRRPAVAPTRTIAVEPLLAPGDTQETSDADGLTEALTTDLGRLPGLRVLARGAVIGPDGHPRPLADLARHLHVDAVIEGGLERSGDSLRINLAVVDPASGVELWSDRFRGRLGSWFAIEDSVADRVASALRVPGPPRGHALLAAPTSDAKAYQLYLQARIQMRTESKASESTAINLLELAVARDPAFAPAYAQLARAYSLMFSQFARADTVSRTRAYVAAARALALDPSSAEAHWANAGLLWGVTRTFPHERAIRETRRALDLDASLEEAHQYLGQIYLHVGLLDSAAAEFREALALNPFDDNAQRRLGAILLYQGRYEDALRTMLQASPNANEPLWNYYVAAARLALGQEAEVQGQLERYLAAHPEDRGGVVRSTRAILRARRGDRAGAEADIRSAIAAGRNFTHFHHSAYNIAAAYAILGQSDRAVFWLRYAVANGLPCYPCYEGDPNLAGLRGDAGYRFLMQDLSRQWRRFAHLT